MTPITFTIPVRTVSEANRASHEHWRKRWKRAKEQKQAAIVSMHRVPWTIDSNMSFVVHLTRVAPRKLDSDNAVGALKACRDGIAHVLGVDDGDEERVTWTYAQERGGVGEYSVKVTMSVRR